MAHFAQIDENNIVSRVLVVPDSQEDRAQEYLANDLALGGTWLQTSYNGNVRKNFAGIGYYFDETRDAFIPPQPFPSWLLDEETCNWYPPTPYPDDNRDYEWDEESQLWKEIIL